MITLSYTINGAKFRRTFLRSEEAAVKARAAILIENGIAVKLTYRPVRA